MTTSSSGGLGPNSPTILGGEVQTLVVPKVNPNSFPSITPISSHKFHVNLAAGQEQTLPIPSSANYLIFNADRDFFVSYDVTPVDLPSEDIGIFNTKSEYNPGQRYIGKHNTIRLKSKYPTYIHLSFYR